MNFDQPARRVLAGWRPPSAVVVTLVYADGHEQDLWTAEALIAPNGAAQWRWFVAVGPAFQVVGEVVDTRVTGLPPRARYMVLTTRNMLGEVVFSRLGTSVN